MDIDQDGEVVDHDDYSGTQIILPSEVHPVTIPVIPQQHRPFFPGQAIPLILSANVWLPVFEELRNRENAVIGVVATEKELAEGTEPRVEDLYTMGCLCRVHRVHHEGEHIQVLLEGLQRFRVQQWVRSESPFAASVRYHTDQTETRSSEEKAYAVAIINIIKELIPLNPLYGEELKVFLADPTRIEPATLADFAASLTTASKARSAEVLERTRLMPRLELVVHCSTGKWNRICADGNPTACRAGDTGRINASGAAPAAQVHPKGTGHLEGRQDRRADDFKRSAGRSDLCRRRAAALSTKR